jgi:hypothetical protein
VKHHFRELLYTNNYIDDLSTLPLDVDGDGRVDLVTYGWFSMKLAGRPVGFLYVMDVNGDGRPDIITSMAHNYGIFWLEHKAEGAWEKHLIDDSWSQPHAVTLVDFRGNHNIGLLTGKRYMAHNGHDPGEREPLGVYWYERVMEPRWRSGLRGCGKEWSVLIRE